MLRAAFRDVCVWVPILFYLFFLGQGFFYSSQLLFFRIEVIGNDARTDVAIAVGTSLACTLILHNKTVISTN